MIKVTQKGDFRNLTNFLNRAKSVVKASDLESFGRAGVEALRAATPVDTGLTAESWYYDVKIERGRASITFSNRNIKDDVPIAIILQYGHATRQGGWVEGRDYINPAIQPIFDKIADNAWRKITR